MICKYPAAGLTLVNTSHGAEGRRLSDGFSGSKFGIFVAAGQKDNILSSSSQSALSISSCIGDSYKYQFWPCYDCNWWQRGLYVFKIKTVSNGPINNQLHQVTTPRSIIIKPVITHTAFYNQLGPENIKIFNPMTEPLFAGMSINYREISSAPWVGLFNTDCRVVHWVLVNNDNLVLQHKYVISRHIRHS